MLLSMSKKVTREQAIRRVSTAQSQAGLSFMSRASSAAVVDSLVALGLLQLDVGTVDPQEWFRVQLQNNYGNGPYYIDQILLTIGANNLDLVEKSK